MTPDSPLEPPIPFTEREWLDLVAAVGMLIMLADRSPMGQMALEMASNAKKAIQNQAGEAYLKHLYTLSKREAEEE